jgi:pimeloyl-ACP methyl ester carboxylesterase
MRARLFCLLLSLLPLPAWAVIVEQTMRPGIVATADYVAGDRDKPAVLVLHGFLQTREFPTVVTLGHGLRDAGYSVLVPTLSLNIPYRKQSLACEAVHRHGMEDDVAEIRRWVGWLKRQGHASIVLVGHSFGSLQLLAYLATPPDPAVKGLIGASLIEAQIGETPRPSLTADLEARIQQGQRQLVNQPLSFCRRYLSAPAALLSYVRWDQTRTLAVLKQAPVPVSLVMGDADETLGRGWLRALRHVQVPMVIVRGANHFMDGEHEFDLLEHTLQYLQAAGKAVSR